MLRAKCSDIRIINSSNKVDQVENLLLWDVDFWQYANRAVPDDLDNS